MFMRRSYFSMLVAMLPGIRLIKVNPCGNSKFVIASVPLVSIVFGSWRKVFHLFFLVRISAQLNYETDTMAPVILVHGIGGSQIEGRWNTKHAPRICDKKSDEWKVLWVDISVPFEPLTLICWTYRMMLRYDKAARKSMNQEGVETRIPWEFGSTKPSKFLTRDAFTQKRSGYFHTTIKELERSGYTKGVNLFAAAFDWRYAQKGLEEFGYFRNVADLIERTASTTKRKVAIVAHSMGGLMMSYFLQKQPQEWKDRYIHAFVAVSTPWLGSILSMELFLIGTDYDLLSLPKKTMKKLGRTFQSSALLLPEEAAYGDTVLIDWVSQGKQYTAKDYQQLFKDAHYETGYLMREDVRSLFPVPLDKLGVRVWCLWTNASKVKTLYKYVVNGKLTNPDAYKELFAEGDGTVPLSSLRYCEKFKDVTVKSFQGPGHTDILAHSPAIFQMLLPCAKAQPFV